jgi:hypothetical protein
MFDKRRTRRVIYNDDADQQYVEAERYGYGIVDAPSFIDARTTPTFKTQVDTYVWCLGNGAERPWASAVSLLPFLKSDGHATDLIVEACHRQGMEVWGSLRMNDIHDALRAGTLQDADDPVKAQHPEWMLEPPESRELPDEVSERMMWTALNFALPEVRDYRLAYIERSAAAHDFDGYELDFTRSIFYFSLGEGRVGAPLMTDLVRRTRSLLDSIGRTRGRPYTFVVHVTDSPRTSLELGLDVATWLEEGLVDVLVVGMGYTQYVLKLAEWLDLARPSGVPVYPSINTNAHGGQWMKLSDRPVYHEALRAASAYYWQEDANGIYLFNLFDQRTIRDDKEKPAYMYSEDPVYIHVPLSDIGDPATLLGKDKLYAIQPVADRGRHQQGCEAAPLPIALDLNEHVLPLEMGPDAASPQANARIRALTTRTDGARIWMRLNNKLLNTSQDGRWCEAEVPTGVLRPGRNSLAVWCDRDPVNTPRPVILSRVFVPVTY